MKRILLISVVLASVGLLSSLRAQAQTAYTIANNGLSLVKFNLNSPGVTALVGNFTGAASALDGIDFRPADGQLYGYSVTGNTVVTINLATAATTATSFPSTPSLSDDLGIDFNPAADRLRLVNVSDDNLRINVGTGVTTTDTPLAYGIGDISFGANPAINEVAYTNNDNDPATGTTLFYLDYGRDLLVRALDPNAGTLQTIGSLGVDTTGLTGFDIFTDGGGGNTGYALLTASSGVASLYTVNLGTGAATAIGVISQSAGNRPYGLAIQPVAVPEPGTAVFGLALLGACLKRRSRK